MDLVVDRRFHIQCAEKVAMGLSEIFSANSQLAENLLSQDAAVREFGRVSPRFLLTGLSSRLAFLATKFASKRETAWTG
jgi:hypothetical protein